MGSEDASPHPEPMRPLLPRAPHELARTAVAVVAVAIGASLFSLAFRASAQAIFVHGFGGSDVLEAMRRTPPALRVLLPCLGGALAGGMGLLAARFGSGYGVGDVMESVVLGKRRISLRVTFSKALGCWFAMVSGGSVGREGPIIQFGGGLGGALARLVGLDSTRARALVAAGTAAGFTAAYNTPFAAILFVVEIVTGVVALDALLPAFVATPIATAVTRAVAGAGPIYGQRGFTMVTQAELAAHAALGILAGIVGVGFMVMLERGERIFSSLRLPLPARAALGGLVVGLCALALPEVAGNGYEAINLVLGGSMSIPMMLVLLLAKPLATTASVSSGSPGGVFTPSLFLGTVLGGSLGTLLESACGPAVGPPGSYALVGMAAAIAATTHAPLMAAVLVFELSGDYAIVLPLLVATALGTGVARRLRVDSIYATELRRRGVAWSVTLEGRRVVTTASLEDEEAGGPGESAGASRASR